MEICPYCGRYVHNFDLHFNLSPRCHQSWEEERRQSKERNLTMKIEV